MRVTFTTKLILVSLSTAIMVMVLLFSSEAYFRRRNYEKMLELLNQDRFIRIRNLSPYAHPIFTPSKTDILDSFQLEIKPYQCTTDSFGFIVTAQNHQKPDLKFAFFGGSTTQCLFVDEDKRMPEAVTRMVERKTKLKINAWNCGAGGTHSYHTLNVLNNMAINLAPDYAFFYGNINDLSTLMHYGVYDNPNPEKGLFFRFDEYQKREGISSDGFLPYTLAAFKNRFYAKPLRDDFSDIRGQHLITDSARIFPAIARVYKTIIACCKANHIKPVLITQRNNFDDLSYEWLSKNMPFFNPTKQEYDQVRILFHQYNDVLRRVAKDENIMLIDLDGKTMGRDGFYDAIHFNSKGSVEVSEIIAAQFIEMSKVGQRSDK